MNWESVQEGVGQATNMGKGFFRGSIFLKSQISQSQDLSLWGSITRLKPVGKLTPRKLFLLPSETNWQK